MSKKDSIKYGFFWIFKFLPESALVFLSGIMVSAAINVFTSQIPKSILTLGWKYIVSAVSMLFASAVIMAWAAIIKPIQEAFRCEKDKSPSNWYSIIIKDKKRTSSLLLSLFILSLIFTVASVVFYFIN